MQMTPPLWQKVRRTKESLDEVKEESEKVGIQKFKKLNIQKTKIMASGPITSWKIDGETMEAVTDFIFLGSKITADGDCSHEIKRRLLLGRKIITNLEAGQGLGRLAQHRAPAQSWSSAGVEAHSVLPSTGLSSK